MTPDYFHLLEMPLLRGRLFSDLDNEKAPQVAVVNEALARTYWPDAERAGQAPQGEAGNAGLDHGRRRHRGRAHGIAGGSKRSADSI